MALRRMNIEKFPHERETMREIGESFELSELVRTRRELVDLILLGNL